MNSSILCKWRVLLQEDMGIKQTSWYQAWVPPYKVREAPRSTKWHKLLDGYLFVLCFSFVHFFSIYKSKLFCGLFEQLFSIIEGNVTWFYNHKWSQFRSLEFPTFVAWQVKFLGSRVWDKQRHDFRYGPRESNFNSSCHGKSGVQGSPGTETLGTAWSLSLTGQLQEPRRSPQNRAAGVNLEKQTGADEDGAGLELLKARRVSEQDLPQACKAFPESFLVSGLLSLLPFPLVL